MITENTYSLYSEPRRRLSGRMIRRELLPVGGGLTPAQLLKILFLLSDPRRQCDRKTLLAIGEAGSAGGICGLSGGYGRSGSLAMQGACGQQRHPKRGMASGKQKGRLHEGCWGRNKYAVHIPADI